MVRIPGISSGGLTRTALAATSVTKLVVPGLVLSGLLAAVVMLLTGQLSLSSLDIPFAQQSDSESTGDPAQRLPLESKSQDKIRVATLNVSALDQQLMSDPRTMAALVRDLSQLDVVAIQGVGHGKNDAIQSLIKTLKALGVSFAATLSKPIGRNTEAESYAFLWDVDRIQFIQGSAYLVEDQADRMHREPMVASFECRIGAAHGRNPFRFTLINAQTDATTEKPMADNHEVNVLDDVFVRVRHYDYQRTGEEDCILLGDLKVNSSDLNELGRIPNVVSITGTAQNKSGTRELSAHILIDRTMTREFTGRSGVSEYAAEPDRDAGQPPNTSQFLPVWAEFSAYEMPHFRDVSAQPVANR